MCESHRVKPGDDDLRLVARRDDGLGALQGRVNPKRRAVERSYPKKKSPARRGRPDEAFVSGRRCGARTIHSDSDYSTTWITRRERGSTSTVCPFTTV